MSREIRAQALLLESILTKQPLPGMTHILSFPESLADNNRSIFLLDNRHPSKLDFPADVIIVTKDEMEDLAPDVRRLVYEFQPPEQFPKKVSVRLRLSVTFSDQGLVPVGEIVATFDDSDPLIGVEPTHIVAY